jgi:ATPase subunit of ABC transporter with duplicated ATPase domains
MNVITKYPIVASNSDAETIDQYRSTYSGFASSAVRRARQNRRRKSREKRRERGETFGQRFKQGAQKVLNNPFVQNVLAQKLGMGTEAQTSPTAIDSASETKTSEGLSKGAKIGIAIGAVAIIGAIVYFVTKKKK